MKIENNIAIKSINPNSTITTTSAILIPTLTYLKLPSDNRNYYTLYGCILNYKP